MRGLDEQRVLDLRAESKAAGNHVTTAFVREWHPKCGTCEHGTTAAWADYQLVECAHHGMTLEKDDYCNHHTALRGED